MHNCGHEIISLLYWIVTVKEKVSGFVQKHPGYSYWRETMPILPVPTFGTVKCMQETFIYFSKA